MMRKPVLAIDVDDTVLPIFDDWMGWFAHCQKIPFQHMHGLLSNYHQAKQDMMNLAHETGRLHAITLGHDNEKYHFTRPNDFWEHPNLYKLRVIPEETVLVLRRLHQQFDIIFVSHCYPEHENSKKKMLDRCLGFPIKFISTPHKEYVDFDVIIDDNVEVIERCRSRNKGKLVIWFENKQMLDVYFTKEYVDSVRLKMLGSYRIDTWKHVEPLLDAMFKG